MKDKLFLDSNIILYAFGEKGHEKEIAKDLIRKRPLITIQVVNEGINVLLRKFNFSVDKTKEILNFLKLKIINPFEKQGQRRNKRTFPILYFTPHAYRPDRTNIPDSNRLHNG